MWDRTHNLPKLGETIAGLKALNIPRIVILGPVHSTSIVFHSGPARAVLAVSLPFQRVSTTSLFSARRAAT